tara:strand:+ start:3120 stop:3269 length:150 start_codon:yes stop_codon:yes gene_type:complete
MKPLLDEDKIFGATVSSKGGDSFVSDFIITQDNNNAIYRNEVLNQYFKG